MSSLAPALLAAAVALGLFLFAVPDAGRLGRGAALPQPAVGALSGAGSRRDPLLAGDLKTLVHPS